MLAQSVLATEENPLAQQVADWLATQTTQQAIDQCVNATNGQGSLAGLNPAEVQAILNGQSCATFITSIKTP